MYFLHNLQKPAKQVNIILRAGRAFGVVLYRYDWQLFMAQSLNCAVIQIYLTDLKSALYAIGINGIAVILGGDINSACCQITDRMIATTVAEFEFESSGSESTAYHLMSQADTHDRLFIDDLFDGLCQIVEQCR